MSDQVNLLTQVSKPKTGRNILVTYSLLFLLVTVFIAVGLLLATFYLKNEEAQILSNQDKVIAQMSSSTEKRIIYQSIHERLIAIQEILGTRNLVNDRYLTISDIIPSDVEINGLQIDAQKIKISLSSNNLSSLNEFLEKNLKELPKNVPEVGRVQVDSVGVQNVGSRYLVSVTIEYR